MDKELLLLFNLHVGGLSLLQLSYFLLDLLLPLDFLSSDLSGRNVVGLLLVDPVGPLDPSEVSSFVLLLLYDVFSFLVELEFEHHL